MLKKIMDRLKPAKSDGKSLNYSEAIEVLESHSVKQKTALAARKDAAPEMLYYLAKDDSARVRKAVAANTSTPLQADQILADDIDDDVRCELAHKISRLVPGLKGDDAGKLLDQALVVLERLADDQIVRVRQILSEELKSSSDVPHKVVRKLATDMEHIVSVPILEYSPLLGDDDLIEIIASGAASEALGAISRRPQISGDVSQAIVSTLDIPAVASLLVNKNAQIREETLDQIIENAETVEEWHGPLVMRPDLSNRAARRIAGFVASSLITTLCERNDLDEDLVHGLKQRVRERIDDETDLQAEDPDSEALALTKAKEALKNRGLDDDYIQKLSDASDVEGIVAGLSLLANLPRSAVRRIIKSRHGKVICALCWRAGLSMRTAYQVQIGAAAVPATQLVAAKDGVEYPLSAEELEWQLDYFVRQTG